jgi:AAA+ superfamily predicted ATPase
MANQINKAYTGLYKNGESPIIQMNGTEPADKINIAASVCDQLSLNLCTMQAAAIPENARERAELIHIWNRESALHANALLIDCEDQDQNDAARNHQISHFCNSIHGTIFISSRQWSPRSMRPLITFEIEKPALKEQFSLWKNKLNGATKDGEIKHIVSQFNLGAHNIKLAAARITAREPGSKKSKKSKQESMAEHLWQTCCELTRPRLDDLARRIRSTAGWEDLILPEFQKNILKEIAAHVRHQNKVYNEWGFAAKSSRGLGISALFAGESGTGKTLASEVLANELHLDLYKIDLSQVVNKYIGETEKNLKKIFDAAEDGGAVLLFDEADALFGKRSEVKDSHDRYANIEVSYLLQRMEEYRGLAILTSNMKSALDTAFLRRIRFIVQFPFPDATQREKIWQKIFPDDTPVKELDFQKLGKLSVAGGNIRNIAMNAAFIAAENNDPVMMAHIARAAKSEYTKIEKPLSNAEIRNW